MPELSPTTDYMCSVIDRLAEHLPMISTEIDMAAQYLVETLLADKKILVAGGGFAAPLAQLLTTALMDQHEIERPGLPAINLASDSITMSSIANGSDNGQVFSKQIRAIGMEGDSLVAIALGDSSQDIIKALEVASEKNMNSILINATPEGRALSAPSHNLHEINLRAQSLSHSLEISTISINTLIKCVESKVFGIPLS